MPIVNYCKKCQAEVPVGETCIYCEKKLVKTGEQISFGAIYTPVREWSCWTAHLRVILPVWAVVAVGSLAAEGFSSGRDGVAALLAQNYPLKMVILLGALLCAVLAVLILQGTEHVHYVFDKDGVHARTYLKEPKKAQIYSRFRTPASLPLLQKTDSRPALEGYVQVGRITIPWDHVRKVIFRREGGSILFFRPRFWQSLAVHCPAEEAAAAEEYIRRKMKTYKTVPVIPKVQKKKK